MQKCGSCHVLARAGTKGVTGPNLDAAFVQSRQRPRPERHRGRGQEADRVPITARPGGDRRHAGQPRHGREGRTTWRPTSRRSPPSPARTRVCWPRPSAARHRQARRREERHLTIPPRPTASCLRVLQGDRAGGPATIQMPNKSGVDHNIAIKGLGRARSSRTATSSFKADLKAGTYTYFCEVPGHRGRGHEGHAHRQVGPPPGASRAGRLGPAPGGPPRRLEDRASGEDEHGDHDAATAATASSHRNAASSERRRVPEARRAGHARQLRGCRRSGTRRST